MMTVSLIRGPATRENQLEAHTFEWQQGWSRVREEGLECSREIVSEAKIKTIRWIVISVPTSVKNLAAKVPQVQQVVPLHEKPILWWR